MTENTGPRQHGLFQPTLLPWLLWIAVAVAVAVWASIGDYGWDVAIYRSAMHSVVAGHDPYAAATAVQTQAHLAGGVPAGVDPPYSYVYPPATLPLLRLLARFRPWHVKAAYWLLYAMAVLGQIWVAMLCVESEERRWFLFFAPLAPFFPGLLANGILMSGNIAYLLYAGVLLAAVRGWRRGSWWIFYLSVLAASYFKAPLLTLVLIAPLSARRQWTATSATVALGAAAFLAQPLISPTLFKHYLEAVNLQFQFNGDFGCSPAGLLSNLLFSLHLPFSAAGLVCYLCYAIPLLMSLLHLSRHYQQGRLSLRQWVPVLIVGVILLNPRLIEYDVAPMTLFLALVAFRSLQERGYRLSFRLAFVALLFLLNGLGLYNWTARKAIDGTLVVALFLIGAWRLVSLTTGVASADRESERRSLNNQAVMVA